MTGIVTLGGTLGPDVRRRSYRDPGSGYEVLVTTPAADPERWQEYLAGAVRSYRSHDVEHALDLESMQDGQSTSLLFVMLSEEGESIGGIRVQGPYEDVEQVHAVSEWEGSSGAEILRHTLSQLVPDGLVELKAAWVAEGPPDRRKRVACLSRTPIHAAMLLGARYAMGTAAHHAVPGWKAAGGVVAEDVPPVAYPDERYTTRLVWWDRVHLSASITESEGRAATEEASQLRVPLLPVQVAR